MRRLVRQHPLIAYFVLAYALTWCAWLPLVAESQGVNLRTIPYQHYLGAVGPIAAAMIVASVTAGRAGPMQLVRSITAWRVKARWYLIALLGPVAVFVVSGCAWGLVTREWFDFTAYGLSDEFPTLGLAGVWMVHTLTFGIGEEMGWRGFALPRLQEKHGALTATILLTVFWALWHIPAFFYRPGYVSMGAADIAGWFFSLLTGAVLLAWLYNSTKGSILIVVLFHGSINVAFTSKLINAGVLNTMGALIVIWAVAVIVITGPSNLSFSPRQRLAPTAGES